MAGKRKLSLDMYLEKLEQFVDDEYGQRIRQNFADDRGSSELAMLETPSSDELEQLKKAVAIMTPTEKSAIETLADEQVIKIAEDAGINTGTFAIFLNGYILECKRVL
jgi:hypothetical protein